MKRFDYTMLVTNGNEIDTYIEPLSGNEYHVLGKFPDSLIFFLDLDLIKIEPLVREIYIGLMRAQREKSVAKAEQIIPLIDTLSKKHSYFKIVRIAWLKRLEELKEHPTSPFFNRYMSAQPFREMISKLATIQEQIQDLIPKVLDIDTDMRPVGERLTAYYKDAISTGKEVFQFHSLSLNYEMVEDEVFAEVLHPQDIYDGIEYHLRECIKQEIKLRRCKNCGRYFAVTGHLGTEYCNRYTGTGNRTCKEVGASRVWTAKQEEDQAFKEYRREYKKRFARMKAGKMTEEEFRLWGEKAREKKAECDAGKMTVQKFKIEMLDM